MCSSKSGQGRARPARGLRTLRTLDLLLVTPLRICGELELRVQQNLMAKEGEAGPLKRVYSHAQSLAQCAGWLNEHLPGAERVPVASNAEAAERAAREPGAGAIAAAVERHSQHPLAEAVVRHAAERGLELPEAGDLTSVTARGVRALVHGETVEIGNLRLWEEQQVEIPISHENRLRDYLFTPEPIARADFFVNCPKFKAHPWTTVTFSLKAYMSEKVNVPWW